MLNELRRAFTMLAMMTLITGVAYPLLVTGVELNECDRELAGPGAADLDAMAADDDRECLQVDRGAHRGRTYHAPIQRSDVAACPAVTLGMCSGVRHGDTSSLDDRVVVGRDSVLRGRVGSIPCLTPGRVCCGQRQGAYPTV